MNKSTLGFIVIAAALIGMLLGYSVTNKGDSSVDSTTELSSSVNVDGSDTLSHRFIPDSEFTNISIDEFGRTAPYNTGENIQHATKELKEQTLEINLELNATVEYKLIMEQGDSAAYAWSVDGGEVYTDFHAHPPGDGKFWTRYSETEGDSDQGTIIAAYAGQHGWYWMNISDEPITLVLKVAGFYDDLIEVDLN